MHKSIDKTDASDVGYGIDSATALYGIIGHPVRHSLSPNMHNAAFRYMGIKAVYLAFDVTDLDAAVRGVRGLGVSGLSVTIPWKEDILKLLDEIDPVADKIGAVNTVCNKNGRLIGYNTDWNGAVRALTAVGCVQDKRVLVLGAGGSARAVTAGLREKGAHVLVANRTVSKARTLAEAFSSSWLGLDSIYEELRETPPDIVVNTTSVGMAPNTDSMPVSSAFLEALGSAGGVVMDIVYAPLETMLLRESAQNGCVTVNGLEMLVLQAAQQFELWTGLSAPVEVMRKALVSTKRL